MPNSFDIALHFGSLIAMLIFFAKDWFEMIIAGFKQITKKELTKEETQKSKQFWYLVLATIPAGIIFFILDKVFGDMLRNELIIAAALIIMGIVLYVVDKKCKKKYNMENIGIKQIMLIGISQVLAFIPGMSRSGSTIVAGRLRWCRKGNNS